MKTLMKILLLTSVFLLALFSCKKDQLELKKTKDPCSCASEVSADFVIEESSGGFIGDLTETDTILKNKWVYFTALEKDAVYKWYIGVEVFTEHSANRYFDDTWVGSNIPITLVVKKDPNSTCFPNDDGYDSITKSFNVSKYPISTGVPFSDVEAGPIEGMYRVKSSHLPDSFDIEVNITTGGQGGNLGRYFNITNYNGFGDSCIEQSEVKGMNYRQIWNYPPTGYCDNLYAMIHNRMDGITEMKMSWNGDGGGFLYYYGRKIN